MRSFLIALFSVALLSGCGNNSTAPTAQQVLQLVDAGCAFEPDVSSLLPLLGAPGATAKGIADAVCASYTAWRDAHAGNLGAPQTVTLDVGGHKVTGHPK